MYLLLLLLCPNSSDLLVNSQSPVSTASPKQASIVAFCPQPTNFILVLHTRSDTMLLSCYKVNVQILPEKIKELVLGRLQIQQNILVHDVTL